MKPISNSFVSNGSKSLRILAVPLGLIITLFSIFGFNSVNALSISVTATDKPTLTLAPGKSGNTSIVAVVLSDDAPAGYTLMLTGPNAAKTLKGTNNGGLRSITDTIWTDEASFDDNTWGIKYCKGQPACLHYATYEPAPGNLVEEIDKTTVGSAVAAVYPIAFGAKIGEEKTADEYSGSFTLAATSNPVYYSVGFVDWTENMPDTIAGKGTIINIPSNTPTKPGYTFAGWCPTKPTNNGTTCAETLIPAGKTNYSLAINNGVAYTNLYATWTPVSTFDNAFSKYGKSKVSGTDYYAMQDMTTNICAAVSVIGEEGKTQLVDKRDNIVYTVAKLIDGKCWLLDNLALVGPRTLTSDDSNVASNFDLPVPSQGLYEATGYTNAALNADNIDYANTEDEIEIARTEWKRGVFYNYAAASAGTINVAVNSNAQDAQYDICPRGWRMPTGGPDGEYQGLYIALGGVYLPISDNPEEIDSWGSSLARIELRSALHLPLAGYFSNGRVLKEGENGNFWSSTRQSGNNMNDLGVNNSKVYPQYSNNRAHGFSIRCVAK